MTYVSGGTTRGVLRLQSPATTPALSAAGEGRIYFDGTQFLASQNGAAYTAVVGGGGGGGWTDDGTVVRLTTVGDGVGIGTASPAAGSKLEVLGDATRLNILATGGNPGGAGTGGAITLTGGLGGTTGTGGALSFTSGAGGTSGDGGSGAVSLASGSSPFGATTGSTTGDITIQTGAFTGVTTDQGDATGSITIQVGGGVDLLGDNGIGGSLTFSAGSTSGASCTAGNLNLSAGSANVGVSTGGSVTLAAGGGYTAGNMNISTQGGGPGGGGDLSVSAGRDLSLSGSDSLSTNATNTTITSQESFTLFAGDGGNNGSILIESKGSPQEIRLQLNPGTPTTSVVLDDTYFTVNATLLPSSGIGDNTSNINIETQSGSLGGNGTSLYITPNLGIILEIGNTIKIDPDGTNNWIYGDDAAVAATPGEPLTLRGGQGNTTGAGGQLRLRGGAGGATGAGANTVIAGGAGGATSGAAGGVSVSGGTPVDGNGGSITVSGSAGVGTNRDGGNVQINPGAATGSGTAGTVSLCATTAQLLRFYGTTAGTAQQTVTGSRGGNAALASLLTALAALGLIVDGTTA